MYCTCKQTFTDISKHLLQPWSASSICCRSRRALNHKTFQCFLHLSNFYCTPQSLHTVAVHRIYCNAQQSLDILSLFPVLQGLLLIYSSEHLSSIAFPIHLTGHARPNSGNPITSVHNFHPSLILYISPNPFEMVAMNLHCIRWCGKRPSPKWLLMMMPHCKECEHSMEMVRQAWRTREKRCGEGVLWSGTLRLGGHAICLELESRFSPRRYNVLPKIR